MVKHHQGWTANFMALGLLVALAIMPFILQRQITPPWSASVNYTTPLHVVKPVYNLPDVKLSANANPASVPDEPTAAPPTTDAAAGAFLVAGEDLRLRTLIHHIGRLTFPVTVAMQPQVDSQSGSTHYFTPTLILPAPYTYTMQDLVADGAARPVPQSTAKYLLVESVLVAPGATLTLDGSQVSTLLMNSDKNGFTSLITWGGAINLKGKDANTPLKITGWDGPNNKPALDAGYGRAYIRAVGGTLNLDFVHVSNLGFSSGRTGGVAWTGIVSSNAAGHAVASRFEHNLYGAFVSRADGVKFSDDLFNANELDGLRLHRNALRSTVDYSASSRNGGNGFVVSRGAISNVLQHDLALNNAQNGFLLNGLGLVKSSSGVSNNTIGTKLESSEAIGNQRTGIIVEGGTGTLVSNNIVCASITGIALRQGASTTYVIGNEIRCGGRVGVSIGPGVTGTLVMSNTISDARIGLLIRNSPGVRVVGDRFTGISVFGISVRGLSPGVVGDSNYIAGKGLQPVDTRSGAVAPQIINTNTKDWQHRSTLTLLGELRYHPILTTWLVILTLVVLCAVLIRFRRRPARPYHYAVPWQHAHVAGQQPAFASAAAVAVPVAAVAAAPIAAAVVVAPAAQPVAPEFVRREPQPATAAGPAGRQVYHPLKREPREAAAASGKGQAGGRMSRPTQSEELAALQAAPTSKQKTERPVKPRIRQEPIPHEPTAPVAAPPLEPAAEIQLGPVAAVLPGPAPIDSVLEAPPEVAPVAVHFNEPEPVVAPPVEPAAEVQAAPIAVVLHEPAFEPAPAVVPAAAAQEAGAAPEIQAPPVVDVPEEAVPVAVHIEEVPRAEPAAKVAPEPAAAAVAEPAPPEAVVESPAERFTAPAPRLVLPPLRREVTPQPVSLEPAAEVPPRRLVEAPLFEPAVPIPPPLVHVAPAAQAAPPNEQPTERPATPPRPEPQPVVYEMPRPARAREEPASGSPPVVLYRPFARRSKKEDRKPGQPQQQAAADVKPSSPPQAQPPAMPAEVAVSVPMPRPKSGPFWNFLASGDWTAADAEAEGEKEALGR